MVTTVTAAPHLTLISVGSSVGLIAPGVGPTGPGVSSHRRMCPHGQSPEHWGYKYSAVRELFSVIRKLSSGQQSVNMLWLEEQPLDLSLKSNKPFQKEINSNNGEYDHKNFNFEEFYRTYLAISVRSWVIQQQQDRDVTSKFLVSNPSRLHGPSSPPVKRKLSGEFENEAKKIKLDSTKQDAKLNKIIKRQKKEEISQIKTSCDCRFCYEDHIKKLRFKSDVPWSIL